MQGGRRVIARKSRGSGVRSNGPASDLQLVRPKGVDWSLWRADSGGTGGAVAGESLIGKEVRHVAVAGRRERDGGRQQQGGGGMKAEGVEAEGVEATCEENRGGETDEARGTALACSTACLSFSCFACERAVGRREYRKRVKEYRKSENEYWERVSEYRKR
eukprot:1747093-Pleurochrysis_carterae.AAC.1